MTLTFTKDVDPQLAEYYTELAKIGDLYVAGVERGKEESLFCIFLGFSRTEWRRCMTYNLERDICYYIRQLKEWTSRIDNELAKEEL